MSMAKMLLPDCAFCTARNAALAVERAAASARQVRGRISRVKNAPTARYAPLSRAGLLP